MKTKVLFCARDCLGNTQAALVTLVTFITMVTLGVPS